MALKEYTGQKEFINDSHYATSGPITLDADKVGTDNKIVPAGAVLGKVTASGLARMRPVTAVATAIGAGGSTEIEVDDARMFVAGDSITVAGGSANVVVSVDYDDNVITVTDSESSIAEDAAVTVADGSQTAIGINMSDVNLDDGDVAVAYMVHGIVDSSKLIAYDSNVDSALTNIMFE
jgi:hypothetical protein